MLSPTPDSLSGGYAPSEPVRPKSAIRQHKSGERSKPDPTATAPTPKEIARVVLRVAKSYGVSCLVNGGIAGAVTVSAAGFVVGCAEGIVNTAADKHLSPNKAAVVDVGLALLGGKRVFIESKFGKGFASALGQALCAAFYPTCHSR
jgi:hypothetical protein